MILKYLGRRERLMIAACFVFIMGQVYLDLRIPEYMSEITDHLQTGTATDIIVEDGVRMLACAFGSLGLALATLLLSSRMSASLCRTLRTKQFQRVGEFSKQDMDSFSAASLVTRSTNDVYQLHQFLPRAVQVVIKAPLIAILALWKINSSAFQWTAVTLVAMLVMLVSFSVIIWRGIPYIRRMQSKVDAVNRITRDGLEGTKGIRAYNAEPRHERRFASTSRDLLDNSISLIRVMSPMHAIASSMLNFLTLAIYWIGAGIIASTGSQGVQMQLFSDMIVFTSYAAQVVSAVMMASNILRGYPRAAVSARRIEEVVEHAPSLAEGTSDPPERLGDVEFRDVCFTYPGASKETLSDISFSVSCGETLAIVGPTGSGKTTLLMLISRMYDATSGTVLVDGMDVRGFPSRELGSRVGYVPQTAVVFSGTVSDNVNFGDGSDSRTPGDVERALRIAQLWDYVTTLPGGIDADLRQHGWNMSGGQRQRLGIARAVCRDPEIYLFDDTFSALDYRTDRDLRAALDRETSGSTRIIVAQRVGTIMDADRILVLDGGRLVGSGRHSDLIETCPLYREIAESQLEVS